jgi:SnoaL-like domain
MKSRRPKDESPPLPDSPQERPLVGRLAAAFEASDVDGLVALLTDDVRLSMPPFPLEYIGREAAAHFYTIVVGARPGLRVVQTRANGQPALATYRPDPTANVFRATRPARGYPRGREGQRDHSLDAGVLQHFGLPRILPG